MHKDNIGCKIKILLVFQQSSLYMLNISLILGVCTIPVSSIMNYLSRIIEPSLISVFHRFEYLKVFKTLT